jgi:hypothetical protein
MCQTGAAFGAAAGHNPAPGSGSHTLKEPVFAGALAFLRLISLFRHATTVTQSRPSATRPATCVEFTTKNHNKA